MKKRKVNKTVKRSRSGKAVIKNAQDAVPFLEWFENKLFKITENTYSLICSFNNAGYLSKTESEKERKYKRYREILCNIPSNIHYEEIIYNCPVSADAYVEAVASRNTYADKYERAFFEVQRKFVGEVDKDHSIQKYLLVLSVDVEGSESPYGKLQEAYITISEKFKEMDSSLTVLSPEEVFAEFYRAYNPFGADMLPIPSDIYKKGLTVRDLIVPDGIAYENDHIILGEHYARVLAVSTYGAIASDNFIHTLSNNDLHVYITKHIDHVEKSAAIEQVRKQLNELVGRKGMREDKNRHIPIELQRSIEGCNELLDELSGGEEFLRQTFYVTVFAKTKEKLNADCERIKSTALSLGSMLRTVTLQTEEAFKSILPLGKDYLVRHQFLLAGEAAVMTPFAYESYFDKNGFYYGANYYSREPIIRNRKLDKACHGFVFGNTGSGKGMWTKHEISNVIWQPFCKNDDVIIIDPSTEYIPLAKAAGGTVIELSADGDTHINLLFVSEKAKELEGEHTAKTSKISSLIAILSELKGSMLDQNERSIIDEAALEVLDKNGATLRTLYDKLASMESQAARDMTVWLKRYVEGSVTLFAGEDTTEQDKAAKITVFDVHKLPSDLRNAAMVAMIERIEERLMQNFTKGKYTWVYIDEMHRYFDSDRNPYAAERFARLYSEARKYGGIITGITQLPKAVLASRDGATMLSNSHFVVFSELDESNIEAIADLYGLNEEHRRTLYSADVGQYVLRTHNAPISVKLLYPGAKESERNEMFDLFNTSFGG